ncbi:MAG: twin-arginine translocase TatA/TatE family subunit [Deltaproteobacteria bacterium]
MFGLGFGELLLIAIVIFVLVGAKKLPQLGQALGETVKSFRKSFREIQGEDPPRKPPAPPGPPSS